MGHGLRGHGAASISHLPGSVPDPTGSQHRASTAQIKASRPRRTHGVRPRASGRRAYLCGPSEGPLAQSHGLSEGLARPKQGSGESRVAAVNRAGR